MPSILLVDDEKNIIEILEIVMREEGMEVLKASSGNQALELLRKREIDIVLSDIRMPDISGLDLLKEAKSIAPSSTFILITAFANTDTALAALQHGAYDYLTKPFKREELLKVVRHALEERSLKLEVANLKSEIETQQGQKLFQALHRSQLVGKSRRMLEIYRTIGTVATGGSTVLITGESGTGKELIARAIHEASNRRDFPFVSINCSAFPETLLESELFGYMRGAFTGAVGNKKGLFEAAHGGSIFLDEIADMTPAMQVKLLRVLQEMKLRPLGGTAEVRIDVRVIAATNRNLKEAIHNNEFREDLYYRIAVINIDLPPLRERAEDIDLLAFHFLSRFSDKLGKRVFGISTEALQCLDTYHWPGNVRELENTIERAIALETSQTIQVEQLPDCIRDLPPASRTSAFKIPEGPVDLQQYLMEVERDLISRALSHAKGNQILAARNLCVTKPSLRHRISSLGIDAARFRDNGSNP